MKIIELNDVVKLFYMYTLMKIHMRLGQYLHRQYDVDKKWPSIGNLTLYMCCEVKRAHTNTTLPESHDLI